jgi:hypothetical protein
MQQNQSSGFEHPKPLARTHLASSGWLAMVKEQGLDLATYLSLFE